MMPSDIDMQTVLNQAQEHLTKEMEILKDRERELKEKRQRIKQLTTHLVDVKKSIEDALVDYALTRKELVETQVVPANTLKSMGFPEVKAYISSVKGQIDQTVKDYIEQTTKSKTGSNDTSSSETEKVNHEPLDSDENHDAETDSSEVDNPQEVENRQEHDTSDSNDGHDAGMSEGYNAGQWQ